MSKNFLIALVLSVPCMAAPKIWFIHELANVNPQTAEVHEAGDLYARGLAQGYKDKNSAWDAAANTLTLKGLKDEVLAFQIVVESAEPLNVNKITLSDFSGPGTIPAKKNVEIYKEWFMKVTRPSSNYWHGFFSFGKGWYASHLIPMDAPDLKKEFAWPAGLPCPVNKIENQGCMVFLADVYVPDNTKPGQYKGNISVTIDGKVHEYKINLAVGKHTIPAINHSNFLAISYGIREVYVVQPEVVRDIHFLMHSHRIYLDPYKYYLETEGSGKDLKIDWAKHVYNDNGSLGSANFTRDILPYLRPRTFTGENGYYGPAKNTAVDWIHLPLQVGWFKRKGVKYGTEEYRRTFLRACELINDKFREWKITQKRAVFINDADEPHDFETLALGKDHADLVWEAREKYGLETFFRIDIGGLSDEYSDFKKGWNVDSVLDYFQDRVQIWNFNPTPGSFPKRDGKLYDFREKRNCRYWIYASNTHGEPSIGCIQIDCERIGVLNWLWCMWKYRVDGGMFWETVRWSRDEYVDSLWIKPLHDWREDPPGLMNGDATELAPGKFVLDNNRPLPGLRLKLIRRASQDYEYFYLLSEKLGSKKTADSLLSAIIPQAMWEVPSPFSDSLGWEKHKKGELHPDDPKFRYMQGKWSHDPERWIATRQAVWEILENLK